MFGNDQTQQTNDNSNVAFSSAQPANNGLMGLDDQAVSQPADNNQASMNSGDTASTSTAPSMVDASNDSDAASSGKTDDLIDIKKEALMELSPLVSQLEQTTDEKFETLMMMIQASDNKSLIPQAFETAKNISDDKKRARALLDIVNEINYFTQSKEND